MGPGIAALLMLLIFRKDGFKITFLPKDRVGFALRQRPASAGSWTGRLFVRIP